MTPAQIVYDPAADQLVIMLPAAEGDGDVVLLRLDVKQLDTDDKRRLGAVRDPQQSQPAPGTAPVTRR